jgi:hypothetical protein
MNVFKRGNAVKKREFRNFVWAEYLHFNEDEFDFIKKRLLKIRELVKKFKEFSYIHQRIEISLKLIDEAIEDLSQIKNERYMGESLNVYLHLHFGSLSERIVTCFSDIAIILSQAIPLLKLSTDSRDQLLMLNDLERALRVPPNATDVFNKFLEESLGTIYGNDFDWNLNIPKPIPISLYSDYRYISPSKAVCTPPIEATYLCRWSTTAHELMHSKIDDILSTFNSLEYATSRKNAILVRNCQHTLERLVHNPSELYYRFIDVQDLFTEMLKLKCSEVCRELYSVLFEDDFYLPRRFLQRQFEEILCDIACTKIAGPAELIVRSHTNADYCRNPELDIYDHLQDLAHPPHTVRIMYESEIITGSGLGLKGEVIDQINKQLQALVSVDILDKQLSKSEGLSSYLIKVYFDTVKDLIPDLSKLDAELLSRKPIFDQKRWDHIIDSYRRLSEADLLEDEVLRPFDLTNIAWLKVMDIFNETIGEGGSYDEFLKERNEHTDFFNKLWKIASSG